MGAAIAASWYFGLHALGVSTVGVIPRGLPAFTMPDFSLIERLVPGAFGIALMSLTETIAPINANRELIATGAGNVGGALLGAMPSGGVTPQTAVVRSAGGQSQRPSLVTAAAAVATMLFLGRCSA